MPGKKEIAAIRKRLELTQFEFAYLVGVHPLTVSKWERGKLTPNEWTADLLATLSKASKLVPKISSTGAVQEWLMRDRMKALGTLFVWGTS